MDEEKIELVPLERATEEPYSLVLSYPKPDTDSVKAKIDQLKQLKVSHFEFTGGLNIGGFSVLGKGVVGIVLVGAIRGKRVALKVRRLDSRRPSMQHEASMLQLANRIGVGPKYLGSTRDILAMEFVEGERLPIWLSALRGRGRRSTVRLVIKQILEQCSRLDEAGLDHGELSRAHKNILVSSGSQPHILDFESASLHRRPSNFTSVTQYFFLGGVFSRKVTRILGKIERQPLLDQLRLYKRGDFEGARQRAIEMLKL